MGTYADRIELVTELAHQEWARGVVDRDGSADILTYFREGLGWQKTEYHNGRGDAWCGAFVAYVWGRGGLNPEARRTKLASVQRLERWVEEDPRRWVSPEDVQPGDILLIGTTEPSHIGLAVSSCQVGAIDTIEGNSIGQLGGDLGRGEGVVTHRRAVRGPYPHVLFGVRPVLSDLGA